jgi:hypothetical protein
MGPQHAAETVSMPAPRKAMRLTRMVVVFILMMLGDFREFSGKF